MAGPARRRDESRLNRQGPRDPIGLTGFQCQEQAPGLEIGAPDRVHDAQPAGRRPADIDAGQLLRGDLARVAEMEPESAQADQEPAPEQGQHGPSRRARKDHPDCLQDGVQLREPLIDMAADQELHRGTTPEVECLGDRGTTGRGKILPRCVGTTPGVRQGIPDADPEPSRLGSSPGRSSRARRYSFAARSKARDWAACVAALSKYIPARSGSRPPWKKCTARSSGSARPDASSDQGECAGCGPPTGPVSGEQ